MAPKEGKSVTAEEEVEVKETETAKEVESVAKAEAKEDEGESGEEESSEEEESSDDEDDFLCGLTAEQKEIIQKRQAALQAQYKKFNVEQKSSKVQDVMTSELCPEGLTEEEAKTAIEACNNDELEAAQRLATEPDFRKYVKDMLAEQEYAKLHPTKFVAGSTGGEKVMVSIDMNGKPIRAGPTTSRGASSKGVSGFKMNGEARVKSLRLGDALAQLDKIKKQKQLETQQASAPAEDSKPEEASSQAEEGAEEVEEQFMVGDKVEAKATKKAKYISAAVKRIWKNGKVEVEFDDGTKKTIMRDNIRTLAKEEATSKEAPKAEVSQDSKTEKEESKSDDNEYTREELLTLGWSEARVKAFMNRKNNPNAYYYRFNAPGEVQATGEWDKTSVELFMELIKEGVNYRWGEFSMQIPGRVGYQCSNYYRKLILEGKITDPNYTFVDGKLKFTRPKGLKRGASSTCTVEQNPTVERLRRKRMAEGGPDKNVQRKKKKRTRRRKGRKDDTVYADDVDSEEDSDDQGAYGYGQYGSRSSKSRSRQTNSKSGKRVTPEPELLPGLRCPMTFEPIYDPAISPYGHVMSYDTWLRVLGRKPKNTCPFTKQHLTRRSLVKLTSENVEEYKSKIVDVNTTVEGSVVKA